MLISKITAPEFKRKTKVLLLTTACFFTFGGVFETVQAQDDSLYEFGVTASEAGIVAESAPVDDAVLPMPPSQLGLNFQQRVRLVKLVLYNEKKDWVDISFRYEPQWENKFIWAIPKLEQAAYYTAYWAILNDRDQLVRGSFSFAFGEGVESPSVLRERERQLLESRNSLPGIEEFQRLSLDPAEIIINGGPKPKFEPPFVPVLN